MACAVFIKGLTSRSAAAGIPPAGAECAAAVTAGVAGSAEAVSLEAGPASPAAGQGSAFDLDAPWQLHPQVSIRPERFGALLYHFGTRRLSFLKSPALLTVVESLADAAERQGCLRAGGHRTRRDARLRQGAGHPGGKPDDLREDRCMTVTAAPLTEQFKFGLDAPICLTWELTYACNLSCVHCLSSSGRRDPRELSTAECKRVIDELERMQVFYVNIGGGEPTVRPDFWELVDYATAHHVGVKFSTNGLRITPEVARKLAGSDYIDVQISLDGATAEVNDAVRGRGSFDMAIAAMRNLADAGFAGFKISVVMTRHNVAQLDAFKAIADSFGAQLRITRLRPSGRGADVWDDLHPTAGQQRELYDWLVSRGENVLTGDSFFHLAGYGEGLPGLNMCGAGRVVCLIDPVGDVYACPFAIHDAFLAGNVRDPGGFADVWRHSELFTDLRRPQSGGACTSCSAFDACQGGCMAAKFFTGLPLDGPDPECVRGFGEAALAAADGRLRAAPGRRPLAPGGAARRARALAPPAAGAGVHRAASGGSACRCGAGSGPPQRARPGLRPEPAGGIQPAGSSRAAER